MSRADTSKELHLEQNGHTGKPDEEKGVKRMDEEEMRRATAGGRGLAGLSRSQVSRVRAANSPSCARTVLGREQKGGGTVQAALTGYGYVGAPWLRRVRQGGDEGRGGSRSTSGCVQS